MKDFIDFLKLPPNILGALSIASGTLLLLPQKLAQKFYIINFREKYGFTIGIVFVGLTYLLNEFVRQGLIFVNVEVLLLIHCSWVMAGCELVHVKTPE